MFDRLRLAKQSSRLRSGSPTDMLPVEVAAQFTLNYTAVLVTKCVGDCMCVCVCRWQHCCCFSLSISHCVFVLAAQKYATVKAMHQRQYWHTRLSLDYAKPDSSFPTKYMPIHACVCVCVRAVSSCQVCLRISVT